MHFQKELKDKFDYYKSLDIHIDMSRGKPSSEQLDLTLPMMDVLTSKSDYIVSNSIDVRNYGGLTGIDECKALMSQVLEVPSSNAIIFGNSSINAMYDQISRSFSHGICGEIPWNKLEKIKWLCPVPGYDRHFAITEFFGIEMINIPMNDDGPDMDLVEEYIKDPSIKGIWCVPKYSNPSGITYSDEVVRRLARLRPAAKDFRIYWDNAYASLDFEEEIKLLNIYEEAKKYNNEDIVYIFTSTSKLSFPGSGIASLGASKRNIDDISKKMSYQTIGYDKINQLRHVRFFVDLNGLKEHAKKHCKILKRKFEIVEKELSKCESKLLKWNKPKGGYFITIQVPGHASEIIKLCRECGVILTDAGSTHPYHKDGSDSYIRIAPSYLSDEDLKIASKIIALCIDLASESK